MEVTEKEVLDRIKKYEEYAEKKGVTLNPNRKIVENMVRAILKKEKLYGAGYCPCRVMTGDIEKDKEIICPCEPHLEEIKKSGCCKCRLFFAKESS